MISEDRVNQLAKTIWDYMLIQQPLSKADVIIGFGSHDKRTAKWAAKLHLDGYAPLIIFSGNEGSGRKVSGFEGKPEAQIYKEVATSLGVNASKILLEDKSTNSSENVLFTAKLIKNENIKINKAIVVHKPYMERRTYATIKAQWPEPRPEIIMSSLPISFEDYISDPLYPRDYMINVMVGDLQRIKEYPKLGFQIEQDIPKTVWDAYKALVGLGYINHLLA